jgi:hypothetical protein
MKKKMDNTEIIVGRVYQHELTVKTVQNQASSNYGKEFISGNLDIATDEDGLNVVQVHYTYVAPTTKQGTVNQTFNVLKKIISENKTWLEVGKDEAIKVKASPSIDLNDFYNSNNELISAKRNEGGFLNIVSDLGEEDKRNDFSADILITSVKTIEADEEKNIKEDYVVIRGAIFNFRKAILPVEFTVRSKAGMNYFENAGISPSEPMFTKVWGKINSTTTYVIKEEESAFGEPSVQKYPKKTKEWEVTKSAKVPYEYGEESALTADEVTKAMQDREVYLAEVKRKAEEWKAQVAAGGSSPTSTVTPSQVAAGGFNF